MLNLSSMFEQSLLCLDRLTIVGSNNRLVSESLLVMGCSSRIFITELLTTEFLIQLPPILSPINELKLSIESSKGIYPTSIHSSPIIPSSIVSNDYSTSNQPNKFRRYINIGDPIAVLGPIDLVSGSVDLMHLFSRLVHIVHIKGIEITIRLTTVS